MSSSQDYFGFHHNIARSEKHYVIACVKTYDNTGTSMSLNLFKKKETTSFVSTKNSLDARIGESGRN